LRQKSKKNVATKRYEFLPEWEFRDLGNIFPIVLGKVFDLSREMHRFEGGYHNCARVFNPLYCSECHNDEIAIEGNQLYDSDNEAEPYIKEFTCSHRYQLFSTSGLVQNLVGTKDIVKYLNDNSSTRRNIYCIMIANITSCIVFNVNKYKVCVIPEHVIICDESIDELLNTLRLKRVAIEHNVHIHSPEHKKPRTCIKEDNLQQSASQDKVVEEIFVGNERLKRAFTLSKIEVGTEVLQMNVG
jgi:hypothetical protein